MCDTMVALGQATRDGNVIFAKNSDRQPNEPHIMIRVPRKQFENEDRLKCTYIEIDQVPLTYEVLLLKPSWIWGCEMGANEFGLNIGNEAVFTKEKIQSEGLIGMDMVRLALERCKTTKEALEFIIELLEEYGQGGNCGYQKNFTYHNSFLIADKTSAWVLETAGKYWAAEKVKDVRSISNCLTIGSSFDKCHPDLIKHAVEKGWCKNEKEFSFKECYTQGLITKLSGSQTRYHYTSKTLEENKGKITMETMKEILRHHEDKLNNDEFSKHSLKSICMHGGFLYGDHTTGSYIASIGEELTTFLVTGSSTPCISIFKPLWLIEGESLTFKEFEIEEAIDFWVFREILHRRIIEGKVNELNIFHKRRKDIEKNIMDHIKDITDSIPDSNTLLEIMDISLRREEELINDMIQYSNDSKMSMKGNLYYRYYWKKQNRNLFRENKIKEDYSDGEKNTL